MIIGFMIELFSIKREEKIRRSFSKLPDLDPEKSINMKFIVAFTFALIVGTLGLDDQQKAKLKEYKESCITESGVDPAIVENAKNGNVSEGDEKLSCFAACFVKKLGIFNSEGNINEEVLRSRLYDSLPEDKVEEIFQKCKNINGDTLCQKGGNLMKCFLDNKKLALLH
ncbi:general odorant-binding protein 56d-like [Vespa velutina]|uniref:general odorant-binding protein 56d-like n=1 Tax=Vespa velutina TaxID=202808 RepID=UPI001FB2C0CC|nr:general odorant-binding protein 56d-like [Vespa velutina]